MKIAIIGGGPAGIYFSILMKKSNPEHEIKVYERNKSDDTFGFGVVFSDQTLEKFEAYDRESYEAIIQNFAYWDDVEINFKGTVHRVGGNGFCGCSRRTLLLLLQERAQALGVEFSFETQITDVNQLDADLIIAADGINSVIRETYKEHFQPQVDLRPNKFTWMGSTKPLDAFTFHFKRTEFGIFIAHAYQYEPGRSTWVLETDPETFEKAGLAQMSEEESARFMERVFEAELDGHPLLTNRSIWRNFPMIRNKRTVMNNIALLGDAKSTAHFSIGSGTKLAMEDAIALYESFRQHQSVAEALVDFEATRREEVEKTQHAADVSLVWFEHLDRYWNMEPEAFAFGLMTRSKAITYDNLELRAPEFVAEATRAFARGVAHSGFDVDTQTPVAPAFQPLRLRDMKLENRFVVSPMCMYSAQEGVVGDFHLVHYGSRAMGGAGLIFTEMTCVSPSARITKGCAGLWSDEQQTAWARITDFVHANSNSKICLQLGHAGRKGATKLMWEGMDKPLAAEDEWPILSASPIPYFPESQTPREMDQADMETVKSDFVASAKRAIDAGFDMLELHCAHGYLLASFLSPITNKRTDAFGGSLENRMRFPLEVLTAIRAAWPVDKPISVRLSATDWIKGGITDAESVAIAQAFANAGADLIDVSTGQTAPESAPVYGRMFQTSFSDQIRNEGNLATMAVGAITSADQANTILAAGRADLVALGRPHLADPAFALRAAGDYGFAEIFAPKQYAPGKDQLLRNAQRAREELKELKIKAKPRTHNPQAQNGQPD